MSARAAYFLLFLDIQIINLKSMHEVTQTQLGNFKISNPLDLK